MARANIEEPIPLQVNEDHAHDDLITYDCLIRLACDSHAKTQLTNILKYGSDTSHEKDTKMKALLDNRYQYTLNSVLGAITEVPADTLGGSSKPLLRRNAVDILNASYASLLTNDPKGAFKVAYAITKKLDNPNEGTMKIMFMDPREDRDLSKETSAVLKLLENIANNVGCQSQEISVNVFDAIIRNLKYTEDSSVYCDEVDILRRFFGKTVEARDWKLYDILVDTFYNRMEELDINKPEDYRVLNNISSVYSLLCSKGKEYIPSEVRRKINRKIFNKSISMVRDCKYDRIRADFISPLSSSVLEYNDENERDKWEDEPRMFNQQISFHARTLKALISLTNEQNTLEGHYHHDATPYLHYTAYNLLSNMLEEYVSGVIHQDKNWITISDKYSNLYTKGIKALLRGIELGNKDISFNIIDKLKNFLSPAMLENPNHPFIKEASVFYVNYYFKKLKELRKKSKSIDG